ncbi:hypothetical protein ACHQM5_018392 [Ranunculus cassubicifolius]
MSTKTKNFRRLHHHQDDGDNEDQTTVSITPTSINAASKPPRKLSFADDDDQELQESPSPLPPLSNPSSSSHKITFTKTKNTSLTLQPSEIATNDHEQIVNKNDQFQELGFRNLDDEELGFRNLDGEELGFHNLDDETLIQEDEDERIWEEEQVRKGLGKRINHYSFKQSVPTAAVVVSRSVEVMSISQQSDIAFQELVKSLSRIQDSHDITMLSLNRVEGNLLESSELVVELEKSLADTGEKFMFMQEIREFVSVLCEFLQHKAPLVEEIEEQMQKIHEERACAMAKRKNCRDVNGLMEIDGEESDCGSDEYRRQRVLLLETAEQAFSDASNDYSQLCYVKEKFEKWKENYPSSYQNAYASMSVVEIFSPYVRLELLKWDPLYEAMEFADMNWYHLLEGYGLPKNALEFEDGDADAEIIPGLVEKIAVPILQHRIERCWDVFSSRQTKNAVCATKLVMCYVQSSGEALQGLLSVIQTRLADAIASVGDFPVCMSLQLLTSICCWKDLLSIPVLEKLALDELLNRKVLHRLQGFSVYDAITSIEKIMVSLNGTWTGSGAVGAGSLKLEPLVNYVMTLGNILEKDHGLGGVEGETSGPTLVRRLENILDELNQHNRGMELS